MASGLKEGSLLDNGKYRVERILGQGGFGITYLVRDIGLNRLRALKEFFPKDFCDRDDTTSHITLGTMNSAQFVDKLKKKFIAEARNIANLDQHHGIITIHAVFEENNTAYYVMDYIEGESLSGKVKRDGPLQVEKAVEYITKVGDALEYVHKHRINHLDVKPANIMVRKNDDMPILIDFGLSKRYDSDGHQTSSTPTGLSHGYAPIEQYNSNGVKEFSAQTDVYSLAATLYYLVSGVVPPQASVLTQSGLTFPENFPEFLKEPILKGMSIQRNKRQQSVMEFIREISKPIHASDEVVVLEATGGNPSLKDNLRRGKDNVEKSGKTIKPVAEKKESQSKKEGGKEPVKNEIRGRVDSKNIWESKGVEKKPEVKSQEIKEIKKDTSKALKEKAGQLTQKLTGVSVGKFPAKKRRNFMIACGAAVSVIAIVILAAIFVPRDSELTTAVSEPEPQEVPAESNSGAIYSVEGILYRTPMGLCKYYGQVNEEYIPQGEGRAEFYSGVAKEYKGNWVNGKMDGYGEYLLKNGDKFIGTFKNNEYSEGEYIMTKAGHTFKGTFKDGEPYEGEWISSYTKK